MSKLTHHEATLKDTFVERLRQKGYHDSHHFLVDACRVASKAGIDVDEAFSVAGWERWVGAILKELREP